MDMDFDLEFDNGDDANGDGADVDSDDDMITESQDSDGFTTDDATGNLPLLYSFSSFPWTTTTCIWRLMQHHEELAN